MNSYKDFIQNAIASNDIPVAGLEMFDSIKNIKLSDFTIDHTRDTLELYKEYLSEIMKLGEEYRNDFLRTIKFSEIIDNQSLEKEDSFLMVLYMQTVGENCIDYLLENDIKNINRDIFVEAHKHLLRGTKSQKFSNKDYRTDDNTFVVRKEAGNYIARYRAIPHKDIEEGIYRLLKLIKSDSCTDEVFLKPQIVHGMVAGLQMFDDGNTRFARILQNIMLFEATKDNLNVSINSPALYGTRSYFPYRDKYRELIGEIVLNPNSDSWNNWFNFNLNRTEDQLFFLGNKVEQYKRILKK